MTTNAKVANYTNEQVDILVTGYKAGETVEALAAAVNHTVRSVIAKLAREGVYVAQDKSKSLKSVVTKASLVEKLEKAVGVTPGTLESLEKATKPALEALVAFTEADEEGF